MRWSYRIGIAGAVCALAGGLAGPAAAQYEAKGLPLGGFRLFPAFEFDANYDDNIFRTQTGSKSDYFFVENPGFTLQSQWGRHELDLYGQLKAYQFASHDSENRTDGTIGGDGRLDVLRGISLSGGGSYSVLHEARTSPDQPGFAKSPTRYTLTQANAVFEYHPYHFGFKFGGTFAHFNYSSTTLLSLPPLPTLLDNDDRDRNEYDGYVKASYEFSPGYSVFVQSDYRAMRYTRRFDRNGLRRNNYGYSVNGGLDLQLTHLIKGELFGGYLKQKFQSPLPDVTGVDFGANLEWTPTPLWTVSVTASRTLNGTTINQAGVEDDRVVRGTVDYKFRPNIVVRFSGGYNNAKFRGSGRDDKYKEAGIAVNYFMNRYISWQLSYDYQRRDSTLSGQDFDDNTASIGLNLHL